MRILVVLACSLLVSVPLAQSIGSPPPGLAVTILDVVDTGTYVLWTPAKGAVSYDVYRGTDLDELVLIANVPGPSHIDRFVPDETVWYVVEAVMPHGGGLGESRGACLHHRGATGLTVTVSHCLPSNAIDPVF